MRSRAAHAGQGRTTQRGSACYRPDLFLGYSHENEYSQDHSQPTSRHQATCSRIEFQHIDRQWGAAESQLLSAASIPNLSDARRPGLAGRPASQTKMAPGTGRVPAPSCYGVHTTVQGTGLGCGRVLVSRRRCSLARGGCRPRQLEVLPLACEPEPDRRPARELEQREALRTDEGEVVLAHPVGLPWLGSHLGPVARGVHLPIAHTEARLRRGRACRPSAAPIGLDRGRRRRAKEARARR